MLLPFTRLVAQPVAACAARCRRMLDALARAGRRRVGGFTAAPAAGSAGLAASAFGRLARALRLIALLELRLRALLAAGVSAPASALPAVAEAPSEPESFSDRDEAPHERDPVERPERLERERPERESFSALDVDKLLFEDARPLTEVVADICRDLGLSREATLRAQAPFAELSALLAGQPPPPKPARRPGDRSVLRSLGEGGEPPGSPLRRQRADARGRSKPP